MFYITFISFFIFLFTLYKKKSIILSSSIFAGIIIVYLLIDYRVLTNVLAQYNYLNVLYLPILVVMLNLTFHNFNDLEKTEVGYNVGNIIRMMFPVRELRFICLFFICLLPISNNLLVNILLLYIISRYLHISKYFSLLVIFLGVINKTIFTNLSLLDFNINTSVAIVTILSVVAIGLILFVTSTDYLQENDLKDVLYENKNTILLTIVSFVVFLLSLFSVFSLTVSIAIASIGAILILSLMSRKNTISIKQETQQNLNKYPYLVSFVLLATNLFIVLFPELFELDPINGLVLLVQIISLFVINLITTRYMRITYINEEDYDVSNSLGFKNNIKLILGIVIALVISILVAQSKYNSSEFGVSIYQVLITDLNASDSFINLTLKALSSIPFIYQLGDVINFVNLDLGSDGYNVMTLMISAGMLINPVLLLIISGLVNIKDKRIIESYYFSLIYFLIIVAIIMIILILV